MTKGIFTERETDVLKLVVVGKTNVEIAHDLYITIHTVKAHITSILRKINGNSRLDIIIWAIKNKNINIEKEILYKN